MVLVLEMFKMKGHCKLLFKMAFNAHWFLIDDLLFLFL